MKIKFAIVLILFFSMFSVCFADEITQEESFDENEINVSVYEYVDNFSQKQKEILSEIEKQGKTNDKYATDIIFDASDDIHYNFIIKTIRTHPEISFEKVHDFINYIAFDEEPTQETLVYLEKTGLYLSYYNPFLNENIISISKLNEYTIKRTDIDPDYQLSEKELNEVMKYNLRTNVKEKIIKEVLQENNKNKLAKIKKRMKVEENRTFQQSATTSQKIQNKISQSKCLQCLVDTDEYLSNLVDEYDRSKCGVVVGLINPVNTVATVTLGPMLFILYQAFHGLH